MAGLEPIIQKIQLRPISLPLVRPFTTAMHTVTAADAVQVDVLLTNGTVGHGAGTPNAVVTGDTMSTLQENLQTQVIPALIGRDIRDWNSLLTRLHASTSEQPAIAAVELALYDLRAKQVSIPLTALLGGQQRTVTTDMTIGIQALPDMVGEAKAFVSRGFKALKIKVGGGRLADDLERVKTIAKAAGPDIRLRLDANQAWTTDQAKVAVTELAALQLPIDFIEQPVAARNHEGLATLTAMRQLPIMADESVFGFQDALALLSRHAVNHINIKLMKTGGLAEAAKIDAACASFGVTTMVGCMIESNLSLVPAIAFAAVHDNVTFTDLDAVYMVKKQQAGIQTNGPQLTIGDPMHDA
ncbi:L-alanine-DL-glutamate epimerase/enolase superfamily-like protein [Lacticaseibacillus paracasei subsp. paracasei Lpp14]|uniref:Dipeptide epimerase n=1 Tax=Lacticaseibacillus paracasei subsp. paracasei Lpp14 TaxID=1256204 RepID=A0A829GRW8_LACPA|nr:L-alanine-DL-glutamate epimerase/enolase superfamily-like protein [Lacticaseibacillus paracasei subsp. paracasei Lpp14]